ncbi:MAG: amino acid-binding protein, partial [Halobacteria archaeon]|nr:amino acid-binding protein [Halobacteria archaeon]
VVDSTTTAILEDDELREVFQNISSIPSLKDVASALGLSVLTIRVDDASSTGLISELTRVVAEHDVSIRQAVSDDPYFTDEPEFTVITNGEVPGELVKEISELGFVEKVDVR